MLQFLFAVILEHNMLCVAMGYEHVLGKLSTLSKHHSVN